LDNGSLASSASSITMHWGYNGWNGVIDTIITRTSIGAWTGFAMVPSSSTQLNMAFFNQSGTWDNNNGQNYKPTVS
jgi:Starch/carbohydrate-binding module (family 53)